MPVVFDSSTLILLAKITLLRDVTERLECGIAETVETECTRRRDLMDAQLVRALVEERRLAVHAVTVPAALTEDFGLDEGEAATIALARELGAVVAVDDKVAITTCQVLGLDFVTAISFVERAVEEGLLSGEQAREKIHRLDEHGRYAPRIIEEALRRLGEQR